MNKFISRCVVLGVLLLCCAVETQAKVFVYRGTVRVPNAERETIDRFILVHDTQTVQALRVDRRFRKFSRSVLPLSLHFGGETKFIHRTFHDDGPWVSDGRLRIDVTLLKGVGALKNEPVYETNSVLAPKRLVGAHQYIAEGGFIATFNHAVEIFDLSFDARTTQRVRAAKLDVSGAIEFLASEFLKSQYSEVPPPSYGRL